MPAPTNTSDSHYDLSHPLTKLNEIHQVQSSSSSVIPSVHDMKHTDTVVVITTPTLNDKVLPEPSSCLLPPSEALTTGPSAASSVSSECPSPHIYSEQSSSHENSLLRADDEVEDEHDVQHHVDNDHDNDHDDHVHDSDSQSEEDEEQSEQTAEADGYSSSSYSEEDIHTRKAVITTTLVATQSSTLDIAVTHANIVTPKEEKNDSDVSSASSERSTTESGDVSDDKEQYAQHARKVTDHSERRTVFVKGLPIHITQREVENMFQSFDGFMKVQLYEPTKDEEKDRARGGPTMAAFVLFETPQQSLIAKDRLNGLSFEHEQGQKEHATHTETQAQEQNNTESTVKTNSELASATKQYVLQAKMAAKNLFVRKEELQEYYRKNRKHAPHQHMHNHHHSQPHHHNHHHHHHHPYHAHHQMNSNALLANMDPRLHNNYVGTPHVLEFQMLSNSPNSTFYPSNTAPMNIPINPFYYDMSFHSPVMNGGLSTTPPSPTQVPSLPYDMSMNMAMNDLALAMQLTSLNGYGAPIAYDVNGLNLAASMGLNMDLNAAQFVQFYNHSNQQTMFMPATVAAVAPINQPAPAAVISPATSTSTHSPAISSTESIGNKASESENGVNESPVLATSSSVPVAVTSLPSHSSQSVPIATHKSNNGNGHNYPTNVGRHNPPCSALFLARLERVTDEELRTLLHNSFPKSLVNFKFMLDSKRQRIAFLQFDCIENATVALHRIDGYKGIAAAFSKNPLNKRTKEGDQ